MAWNGGWPRASTVTGILYIVEQDGKMIKNREEILSTISSVSWAYLKTLSMGQITKVPNGRWSTNIKLQMEIAVE